MTTDERALRAAIRSAPDDAAPCLVFADWLEERGRLDAARHWRHRGLTMGQPRKPTIPEVIDRFVAYLNAHGAWGSLHVTLDDGNVHDDHVRGCIEWAAEHGDEEGRQLGEILLRMSPTQRLKLPHVAWLRSDWRPSLQAAATLLSLPTGVFSNPAPAPNGMVAFTIPAEWTLNTYRTVPPANPEPMVPDPVVEEVPGHAARVTRERTEGGQ